MAERLCRDLSIERVVTATTRPPRPGEVDGRDYWFLTEDEFLRRLGRGEFLEHARVHGALYGTPREPLEAALRAGETRLLVIDVQGAMQVKAQRPEAMMIFLDAPDDAVLGCRLAARGTEDERQQATRRATAAAERKFKEHYDHCIVNDDLERTVAQLRTLLAPRRGPEDRRRTLDG